MSRRALAVLVVAGVLFGAPGAWAAPPANDNLAANEPISAMPFAPPAGVSTLEATLETGEPQPCGLIGATVWYRYVPVTSGSAVAHTFNLPFQYDTAVAVYTGGSFPSMTVAGCNDDYLGDLRSAVFWSAVGGTTYYIQLGGFNSKAGTAGFAVDGPAAAVPPSPPQSLTATPGAAVQSIDVSWNPSASDGGLPLTYTVCEGSTPGAQTNCKSGLTSTSATFTGLDLTTKHYFVARALNAAGSSGNSNEACMRAFPWLVALDCTV